jgi:pimeloyl-ACP methyl ester carboxylesterase
MSTPPFLELPAGTQARQLATPRGSFAALQLQPPEVTGAPVLLVPGYTGSKEDFIGVLAPIAGGGHPVLALDLRGQFESAGTEDPTAYDVKALADDVLAVLAGLEGPAHVVGHSFGGLVTRSAAVAEASAFRSLTLLSSGPAAVPPPADANIGLLAQALPALDLETIWTAKRQLETAAEVEHPAPEIEAWLHTRFVTNHPVGLLQMALALLGEPDRTDELAAAGVPLLVAYGDRDDVWPPAVQAAMAERLGARVAVFEDTVHSPAAQAPEATTEALLAFWADC